MFGEIEGGKAPADGNIDAGDKEADEADDDGDDIEEVACDELAIVYGGLPEDAQIKGRGATADAYKTGIEGEEESEAHDILHDVGGCRKVCHVLHTVSGVEVTLDGIEIGHPETCGKCYRGDECSDDSGKNDVGGDAQPILLGKVPCFAVDVRYSKVHDKGLKV